MLTRNFLRGRRGHQIRPDERLALERSLSGPVHLPAREEIVPSGVDVRQSTLLLSGLVGRYIAASRNRRQLVALHIPGEFVDLHGYPLGRLDHSVEALTPVSIAAIEHDRLTELIEAFPHLGRIFWFSTLLDAATHRQWIFRMGRLDAEERVAHFFCEMGIRLAAIDHGDARRFRLPLTQTQIGHACGLTNVHVSRVLAGLRKRGLLHYADGVADLPDPAALAAMSGFSAEHLYVGDARTIP